MMKFLKICTLWSIYLLSYTAIILALGTIVGAILFMLLGKFFVDSTLLALMKKGAWIGFRYAGVWAGGTAIVLCFIKGAQKNHSRE